MALKGSFDLTKNPIECTVVSDRRKVSVDVSSAGDTLTLTGQFPIKITDSSGRVWTVKSDDGATAVYTSPV